MLRVRGGTPEHFGEEHRDVAWMVCAHVREDRREQGILFDMLVEARSQADQCITATEPLVQCGNDLFCHRQASKKSSIAARPCPWAKQALIYGAARASSTRRLRARTLAVTWPAHGLVAP